LAKKSNSLFGWLGRQIGFVKAGVKAEVPNVVYRKQTVKQAPVEGTQQFLRRTTIDEVIVPDQNKPRKD